MSPNGWQRGYRLVKLAEVEPVCALLAAERPTGWAPLIGDLLSAREWAQLKRLPPTAFKFPVGDRAEALGRALSVVRNGRSRSG